MSHTVIGGATGAVLALTWVAFGFWAFIFVTIAVLLGAGVARVLDGRLSLRSLSDALRGRHTS